MTKPIPGYVIESALENQPSWATYAIVLSDGGHDYSANEAGAHDCAEEHRSRLDVLSPHDHTVVIINLDDPEDADE